MSKKKERSEWFGAIDHLNLGSDTPTTKNIKADGPADTPSASTMSKDSNVLADLTKSVNSSLATDTNTSGEVQSRPIIKSKNEAVAMSPKENVPEVTPRGEDIAPTESSRKTRRKKKQTKEKEVATPQYRYITARLRNDLYEDILRILYKNNKTDAMEKVMLYFLSNHCKELEEVQRELGKTINKYKNKS